MKNKFSDKEIIEVLNVISVSAQKVLKNVKKKDTLPISEAEQLLCKLKSQYLKNIAAE